MTLEIEAAKIVIEKPPQFSADGDYVGHEEIDPLLLDQLRFTVLADYETYVVGEVVEADLDRFRDTASSRGLTHEVRRDFDQIQVNGFTFGSSRRAVGLPRDLEIDRYAGSTGLFLVQTVAPLTREWHDAISGAGDIVGYLPQNTFIVRATVDAGPELANIRGVQHVSIHQPAFRVRPTLLDAGEPVTVDIQFDGEQDLDEIVGLLTDLTGRERRIERRKPYSYLRTILDREEIAILARRSEVLWIERALPIDFSGERQATIVAGLNNPQTNVPERFTPDGHHGWLLSKNFCTPTEAPEGCWPYWTKIGVVDSGLDKNVCVSGYEEDTGACGTWGDQEVHQDLNHRSNIPGPGGPCDDPPLSPENPSHCDGPVVRGRFFCAKNASSGPSQCIDGSDYKFSDEFGWAHGTNSAAIIAGDPLSIDSGLGDPDPPEVGTLGFFRGTGVAPSAQVVVAKQDGYQYAGDQYGMGPGEYGNLVGKVFRLGAATCGSQFVRFTNNSWNLEDYRESTEEFLPVAYEYTSYSQMADQLVRDGCGDFDDFDSDMTIIFSAGNFSIPNSDPNDPPEPVEPWVTSPGNAKNVISVGASRGWTQGDDWPHPRCDNHPANGDHLVGDIAGGADLYYPYDGPEWHSRRGFKSDTGGGNVLPRYKPDLVAPGTQCAGVRSRAGYPDPAYGGWYACSFGTSAAAPAVSGAAVLADAWYINIWDKGDEAPSPAMLKALLVAHADNLHGGLDHLPDPASALPHSPSISQGWGRVNLDRLFHEPDPTGTGGFGWGDGVDEIVWDQDHLEVGADRRFNDSGQYWKKQLVIDVPNRELVAVLVYTDRFAVPEAASFTVNNLDLTMFTNDLAQARSFWGNRFDVDSPYSKDWGGPTFFYPGDTVNTVEVIRIPPNTLTQADPIWIRVGARHISLKAVPGLDGDAPNQDFALYVYNAKELE